MFSILLNPASLPVLWCMLVIGANHPVADNTTKSISIIPQPQSLKRDDGSFVIGKTTKIILAQDDRELSSVGEQLAARLRIVTGYPLEIKIIPDSRERQDAIVLSLDESENGLGKEGYQLRVSKKSALIKGAAPAGVFYGIQTLYQLLPVEVEKDQLTEDATWAVPCIRIEDKPRFPWRGMHLDVGRHFFSKDSVKRFIDLLAMYKMNTFHWHLTEDQGWRIEIKKYPRLTTVGAWRKETMEDNTPHGGFYTQDEIREVVEYARQRFITVVPEIEMPGHSLAALASYPELSCSGGAFKVGTEWGVNNDVYCAGNEKTFQFLEDVIGEVVALFPGPFFHIGGDEVPKLRWSNCKRCQDRIKAEGLKNESELQSYFVTRIEKIINARGKRLVGWDEILEGGLAPNATVMSWRGIQGGIEAAKSGHDVVMTPASHCYFDYYQDVEGEPKAIGEFLPIDTVYSYEPVPSELSSEEAKHVLGAQGNLWSEWMPHFRQVEYMAFPRMCAMSEVLWSDKSKRNFENFTRRLEQHYGRLAMRDVNFRVPTPLGIGGRRVIFGDTVVVIKSPVSSASIYYTLDGQDPSIQSTKYSKPVAITGEQTLKALLALPGGKMSNPVTTNFLVVDPKVNGVEYRYFEGNWDALPDMRTLQPIASGRVFDVNLKSFPHREDEFGVQFDGFLNIASEGEYTLHLASDDGSKLFIDGRELINNDGLHGLVEVSGKVNLDRGKHKLEVWFFERGGNQDLSLSIEGPRLEKQPLPPRMLTVQ